MRSTARPSPRPAPSLGGGGGGGGSTVRLVGNGGAVTVAVSGSPEYIRSDTDRRTRAQLRPSPVPKYESFASTKARVDKALQETFPKSKYVPYGRVSSAARWLAGTSARASEAAAAAYEAAQETSSAMKYLNEVVANQWWQQTPAYDGPNPGLTFLENRTHTTYGVGSTGIWWDRPLDWGRYTNGVDQRRLSQNTWLRSTVPYNALAPSGYLDNVMPVDGLVPNSHYLYVTKGLYWLINGTSLDNYYASVDIFRNLSGSAQPGFVSNPAVFPLPLGVPVPSGTPSGFPLQRALKAPKPLPRFQRVDEITVVLAPNKPPRVVRSPPRRPGPKATEKKSYGKSGVASAVFWLYEASDDWVDWLKIVFSAIPDSPGLKNPIDQMRWLQQNPEKLITARWEMVIAGMAGWFVDELFGAFIGNINKRASRSTSSGTTIDMRQNVALHYGQSGASPGSVVSDFIQAFI